MRLQRSTGLFPRILGKGDNAKKLADLLLIRMRSEEEVSASSATSKSPSTFGLTPSAVVENVIIIDREIDFFTPLMTQLTYEGLIDEVFGIRNNQTEVDTSIVGAAPQQQKPQGAAAAAGNSTQAATKRKIQLDSSDKLYPELCSTEPPVASRPTTKPAIKPINQSRTSRPLSRNCHPTRPSKLP
jgi:hypothetical protein